MYCALFRIVWYRFDGSLSMCTPPRTKILGVTPLSHKCRCSVRPAIVEFRRILLALPDATLVPFQHHLNALYRESELDHGFLAGTSYQGEKPRFPLGHTLSLGEVQLPQPAAMDSAAGRDREASAPFLLKLFYRTGAFHR